MPPPSRHLVDIGCVERRGGIEPHARVVLRENPGRSAGTLTPPPWYVTTVWLEEMTWMDVRDARTAGSEATRPP